MEQFLDKHFLEFLEKSLENHIRVFFIIDGIDVLYNHFNVKEVNKLFFWLSKLQKKQIRFPYSRLTVICVLPPLSWSSTYISSLQRRSTPNYLEQRTQEIRERHTRNLTGNVRK